MKDYVRELIRIFAHSTPTKRRTDEVHQWLISSEHTDEKEAALFDLWRETEAVADAGLQESLDAVYRKAGVNRLCQRRSILWPLMRYVAVVALLVGAVSTTYHFTKATYSDVAMIENYTPAGELLYIELPDGSQVQTNSGSLLLYPEKFTGDTRTVFLIGEASFKVKSNPDKPFVVRSNMLSVTALGTEFNVAAYPEKEELVATLLEGKIKVTCGINKEEHMLLPGQQLSFHRSSGESRLEEADRDDVTAWQRGVLLFRSVTVKEMLLTLERKYNVEIRCDEYRFNEDKYNFRFLKQATLQEVLSVMQEVVGGFSYTMQDERVCIIE